MVFRRAIRMALALVLTGLLPALAAASCVDMPCCDRREVVVQQAGMNDCCTPVTCAKESKAIKNASPSHTPPQQFTIVAEAVCAITPQIIHSSAPIAASPPSTSERLSILSILLI